MHIRHVVAASNIDEDGYIVEPTEACHGIVVAGRIADLSGCIDPLTHLNADFRVHALGDCVIAESLEVGAKMVTSGDGMMLRAATRASHLRPLGRVDIGERRLRWLEVHRVRREGLIDDRH